MSSENRVVHIDQPHMYQVGGDQMSTPSKTYNFGNTKVKIHSKLVIMSKDEKKQWWDEAMKNKSHPDHQTVLGIVDAVHKCTPRSV